MVRKAVDSFPASQVERVVIGVPADIDHRFGVRKAIHRAFGSSYASPVEVVIIDHPTAGPGETINLMIEQAQVTGAIAIKDCDSFFEPISYPAGSFVSVCDLRENLDVVRVGEKSFVLCNEQGLVGDIVEKVICSNLISVGLYGFSAVDLFRSCYANMLEALESSAFYISHMISAAVANGEIVTPVTVDGYVDVDSDASWLAYRDRHITLMVDIDGVVFENHSRFFPPYWEEEDRPIDANVAHLLMLQKRGAQLVFMTARPEQFRHKTLSTLQGLGFNVHGLVTGCLHGRRYLVNDFAPSNPYPSAVALNLGRNMPDLSKLVR